MENKIVFIYDGQCPFCKHFSELIELNSGIPNLQIKNARENPDEMPSDYDMDLNGAILIKDGQMFYGASAINFICSEINDPSSSLLAVLKMIFKSRERTFMVFPFLLLARRIALFFKGQPRKLIF